MSEKKTIEDNMEKWEKRLLQLEIKEKSKIDEQMMDVDPTEEDLYGDNGVEEKLAWEDAVKANEKVKKSRIAYEIQKKKGNTQQAANELMILNLWERRVQELIEKGKEGQNENQKVDEEKLNYASTISMSDSEKWEQLSFVHSMVMQLEKEKLKSTDETEQKKIGVIVNLYKERRTVLVDKRVSEDIVIQAQKERETGKEGETDSMIRDIEETEEREKEERKQRQGKWGEEIGEEQSIVTLGKNKERNEMSSQRSESQNNKKHKSNQHAHRDFKSALIMRKNETGDDKNKVHGMNERNEIRVRFQFKLNRVQGKRYTDQIKYVLYDIMQCVKEIDRSAKLMVWDEKDEGVDLDGQEIQIIGYTVIGKYIDSPTTMEVHPPLLGGRMYYHQGIRIKTDVPVYEFTETWNNMKYTHKETHECLNTISMKIAEMQKFSTPYPVGYFAGTTDRGDYTTLQKYLMANYSNTEASYQILKQQKISKEIWIQAKEKAEEVYDNPYSKEYRRRKFKFSPSALVVYVGNEDEAVMIRRKLYQKYGSVDENGQWPVMIDGSRMKFIPLMQGATTNETVYAELLEAMEIQAQSKGYEVMMDINIKDIYEQKEYLSNRSIEDIIHSTTSTNPEKGKIPLFKHICRKWTRDASVVRYEVAVQPLMEKEAIKFLKEIKKIWTQYLVREHVNIYTGTIGER